MRVNNATKLIYFSNNQIFKNWNWWEFGKPDINDFCFQLVFHIAR